MGARKAHEEGELTGSEPAGVFARSNSETWPMDSREAAEHADRDLANAERPATRALSADVKFGLRRL
jgi:hypothetical protein